MPAVFELRRDPVTGWWSAIVTDRAFEHASFAVEAQPVEGSHCRHCDEAPADAPPQLAAALVRGARDAMRQLSTMPREAGADGAPEPLYIQVVQSYGRQAGSRAPHLNLELYAIPQVPHWVAEEIGGGARYVIKARRCVWCGIAEAEEEAGERLVFADHHAVVLTP